MMNMLVLHPSLIITMDEKERVLKDYYLGIENGKICYLDKKKPENFEELIELPKRVILPGFVNSHTHVAMIPLRGLKDDVDLMDWLYNYILPAEAKLKPSDVYYGALYGIAEMISSGITTFADMYYHEIEIAKAVLDAGVRALLGYSLSDIWFKRPPEAEVEIAEKFYEDLEGLKRKRNDKNHLFFAYAPHSAYGCSKECLLLVRERATTRGVRIHIHLSETLSEVKDIEERTGLTPIKYLDAIGFLGNDVMAAHVVWVMDDTEFEILRSNGVNVLHNPTSNLKLASGIAPVPKMLELGINVALATDGPASNNRLDMMKEMHIAALIHKGVTRNPKVVSAKEVLKMATINGAKALGLDDKIGSVEIGKLADFVVINLQKGLQSVPEHDIYSMIVYSLSSNFIESVFVGGKRVYHEGVFEFDIEKVKEKIIDIRKRLEKEIKKA